LKKIKEFEKMLGKNSTGQTELIDNVNMQKYVAEVRNCKISESTAMFIASIRVLGDLSGLVYDGLTSRFSRDEIGEKLAEKEIQDKYRKVSDELNAILYDFLRDSIFDNVSLYEINQI